MLEVAETDQKFYILKRLREIHEFALKLPDAQRLPYLRRLWKESPGGVPEAREERIMAKIHVEWANSLSTGVVQPPAKGDQSCEMAALTKRLNKMEADAERRSSLKDRKCFCCDEIGHTAIDCPLACKVCSTPTRAAKIGTSRCTCAGNGQE